MRIQHNIMAMNAYRNYNTNTSALSKNLEKLSSGYKINRAGDDAAGLAISEKMRAQITGLSAAQKNVKDGISLVKTAEGAMQEIQDMLNRMDYLATQSANGTYDDPVDRANLQKEVDALKTEIDRIADSANFNGIKLLDGSMDAGKEAEVVAGTKTEWTDQVMNAVDPAGKKVTASLDGKDPSPASKATLTITYGKGADLKTALSASSFLGAPTGGSGSSGAPLADIFEITNENGETVDLTTMDATATANEGGTLILTAKNEGAFDSATWEDFLTALEGKTAAKITNIEATNGIDVGGAASSGKTKAKYEFTFDLTQLKGGETLEFNGKKILFDKEQKAATAGTWGVEANGQDTDTYYIGIKGVDLSTDAGQEMIAKALSNAFLEADMLGTDKFEQSAATNSSTKVVDAITDEGKLTIKVSATDTNKGVVGNVHVSKFEENENSVISVKVTPGQEDSQGQGQGQAVTAKYNVDLKKLKVGDKISVGGVELEIVEDGDHDSRNGKVGLTMAKTFATDEKALHNSLNAAGYSAGNVTVKGSILTVEKNLADSTTAEAWSKGDGSFKMGKTVTISEEEAAEANKNAGPGKALTLQIGDTSDKFNQMNLSIGDMHVKAMGTEGGTAIADISIATQEGAQAAVQTIKDAINYVSSIRGDLGATQNRLEHTANNLSVMAENIQDAESTIRDTDVAEEMMAYTKNNILIQSAQAMLAQANAVPQGVLQLLG